MPFTRSRINSASSLPDSTHPTLENEQPSHSSNAIPIVPITDHHALPPRDITQNDLLSAMHDQQAAMRDQQAFITHQQTLFQQERDYNRTALREQHDFMAEQQCHLMSLLVQRTTQDAKSSIATNFSTGPKVRMPDPPSFDGSIKETENFLGSLENIFASQPQSFPSVESKVRYALTFLTGGASNWRKLLLRDISNGYFDFSSWKAFEERFRETFGNPHLVEEARRKLWTIRQGSRTSEDFFLEFEAIRLEADICENSLIMFLQAALRPSILSEVLRHDPPPKTYTEWKSTSLRADHNQRNSAATKQFHNPSSSFPHRPNALIPF